MYNIINYRPHLAKYIYQPDTPKKPQLINTKLSLMSANSILTEY